MAKRRLGIGEVDAVTLRPGDFGRKKDMKNTKLPAHVLFLPLLQRTRGGTEAFYLLLQYGFERLGLRRFEWRYDSDNDKSERADLLLGSNAKVSCVNICW